LTSNGEEKHLKKKKDKNAKGAEVKVIGDEPKPLGDLKTKDVKK